MPIYEKGREIGDCYLVAPLYSVKDTANRYKYEEEFILKVQAYQYPSMFYVPDSDEFNIQESIVRFDKMCVINRIVLRPIPVCLTDDGYYCLINWFNHLMGAELDEILTYYRKQALKTLEK